MVAAPVSRAAPRRRRAMPAEVSDATSGDPTPRPRSASHWPAADHGAGHEAGEQGGRDAGHGTDERDRGEASEGEGEESGQPGMSRVRGTGIDDLLSLCVRRTLWR